MFTLQCMPNARWQSLDMIFCMSTKAKNISSFYLLSLSFMSGKARQISITSVHINDTFIYAPHLSMANNLHYEPTDTANLCGMEIP